MNHRIYNYSAFYVAEPFSSANLGAYCSPDFCYYNTLRMWKGKDNGFPFFDAHQTTYSVRDGSDWEYTLKPRLHKRLCNSKNIILFLSNETKYSRALKEEIEYGIGILKLPVIVIYPEFNNENELLSPDRLCLNNAVKRLWDKIPTFRRLMDNVPTLHIPMNQTTITKALENKDFTIQNKCLNGVWFYK